MPFLFICRALSREIKERKRTITVHAWRKCTHMQGEGGRFALLVITSFFLCWSRTRTDLRSGARPRHRLLFGPGTAAPPGCRPAQGRAHRAEVAVAQRLRQPPPPAPRENRQSSPRSGAWLCRLLQPNDAIPCERQVRPPSTLTSWHGYILLKLSIIP
jgi:hypothetical protein